MEDGIKATFISDTSFILDGNRTQEFVPYRRVRADCQTDGVQYGSVRSSTFNSETNRTTVTLFEDALTPLLSEVWYAITAPGDHGAFPERYLQAKARRYALIYS